MNALTRDDFWLEADAIQALVVAHAEEMRQSSTNLLLPDSPTVARTAQKCKSVVELALLEYLHASATATASATAAAAVAGSGVGDDSLAERALASPTSESDERSRSAMDEERSSLEALRRRANAQHVAVALLALLVELHVRDLRQPLSLLLDPLPEWDGLEPSSSADAESNGTRTSLAANTAASTSTARREERTAAAERTRSSRKASAEHASRQAQSRSALLHDLLELCTESLSIKYGYSRSRPAEQSALLNRAPNAKRALIAQRADAQQRAAVREYALHVELVFAMQHTFEATADSANTALLTSASFAFSSSSGGELQRFQLLQLYLFGLDQIALTVVRGPIAFVRVQVHVT